MSNSARSAVEAILARDGLVVDRSDLERLVELYDEVRVDVDQLYTAEATEPAVIYHAAERE